MHSLLLARAALIFSFSDKPHQLLTVKVTLGQRPGPLLLLLACNRDHLQGQPMLGL